MDPAEVRPTWPSSRNSIETEWAVDSGREKYQHSALLWH